MAINKNFNVSLISITPGCEVLNTVKIENIYNAFTSEVTKRFTNTNKYRGWNFPENDLALAIDRLIRVASKGLENGCPEKIEIFNLEYDPKVEGFFYMKDYGMLPYGLFVIITQRFSGKITSYNLLEYLP